MTHTTCLCGCQSAGASADAMSAATAVPMGARGAGVPRRPQVTRRAMLTGSAAVAAGLALAACSSPAETATSTPTPSSAPTPTGSPSATESATPEKTQTPEGERLVSTSDLAVGGGAILTASVGPVVVTHPGADEFKAFNAKCPHQGCPVASVADNTIRCNCHGSMFDAATGDRTAGPAPTGLTPLDISVEGDAVHLT